MKNQGARLVLGLALSGGDMDSGIQFSDDTRLSGAATGWREGMHPQGAGQAGDGALCKPQEAQQGPAQRSGQSQSQTQRGWRMG